MVQPYAFHCHLQVRIARRFAAERRAELLVGGHAGVRAGSQARRRIEPQMTDARMAGADDGEGNGDVDEGCGDGDGGDGAGGGGGDNDGGGTFVVSWQWVLDCVRSR